jgi:integrase
VQSYLDEQATARSANASNRDRKNLLAMWNYGCKFLGLQENPVNVTAKRAHDRKPPYTPPTEDVLKVFMVATREEQVLLNCYFHTAARRSEIFRLTWVEDINFERRKIRLGTRKTKDGSMEYTWLPMSEELYESLSWWWKNRKFKRSPYVFVDDHPGPNYGKRYKVRRRFMRSLCERAGVKPFGFHALRRFVASRLADMGKSTKTIQQLLRHKKLHTTERYIQSINDGLKGVTDGLFEEKGTKARHENKKGHS